MSDTQTSTESAATRNHKGIEIPVPGEYVLDTAHTTIEFVARHLMISKVRGRFTKFEGSIRIADDPEESELDVTVDTASVDTSEQNRDAHLRSADFFDAEKFPNLKFRSTKVDQVGETEWKLRGDLTIREVTQPVTLDVEFLGVTVSPWGTRPFGFEATAEIDREDWGLTYNQALETGGVVIGKKVRIEINAELLPKQ